MCLVVRVRLTSNVHRVVRGRRDVGVVYVVMRVVIRVEIELKKSPSGR